MLTPALSATPNSKSLAVRFGVITTDGLGYSLPIKTDVSDLFLSSLAPNVVRMTFSDRQARVDDAIRAPSTLDIVITLDGHESVASLRAEANRWQSILQNAQYFVTNDGHGVKLLPGRHGINHSSSKSGLVIVIVAKLVPAILRVYGVNDTEGVTL